jgi:large subunit ribosomal protein L25
MNKVNPIVNGEIRELLGRKVKQLRKNGLVPATVYGHDFKPMSIQMNARDMGKAFEDVGESGLVDLMIDGKKYPILFRNPQYHPIDGAIIHIDCYKVNLREKITTTVPVELVGEAPAVKLGNVLVAVTDQVEVEALPANLPEKIEVDISGLENVDQVITVADLKVDTSKVEIKTAMDQLIVKLEVPKEEEVAEETTVAPGEVPATEQKPAEEGEGENKE